MAVFQQNEQSTLKVNKPLLCRIVFSYEAKKGVLYSLPETKIFCYPVMRDIIPVPKMYDTPFEMVAFAENTRLS